MEQEKIDVARATPVSKDGTATAKPQRGAPLWLQILLSLIVIVLAVGIAGLFNPTANSLVKRVGIALPMLNGSTADAQPAPQAQAQGQGGQAQGQRPGGGQGGAGRQGGGGFGGNRSAIVVTAPVTTGTINNKLSSIGEGSAIHSVTVSSASGGTLMTVDVKPGDQVKAGQQLATLDSATQQNALDKAKLAAEDADSTLARTQSLAKTNSVPQTQVATAQLAADTAKLAVQAAQIALDQRTILTPVAGTVGIIQVTPGNLINAQTVVTTIEDSSEILVNFYVPERYSSQIALGAAVTAESAALPGKSFQGTISAIDNKIDTDSRTLQVQATLPNADGTIKSGMSFSVDMAFPGQTFPSVDPLSVQWSNDGAYVWKVVDSKAVKGMVEIIQRNSDGVLVKGDVKQGDSVVTQGVLQLSDGLAVRLLDAPQPAASGATQGGQEAQAAGGDASAPANGGKRQRQSKGGDASASASQAQGG